MQDAPVLANTALQLTVGVGKLYEPHRSTAGMATITQSALYLPSSKRTLGFSRRQCGAARPGLNGRQRCSECLAYRGREGISSFIAQECPVRGLDGKYREQPREGSVTAVCLPISPAELFCPGSKTVLEVEKDVLDCLIKDDGQVVLSLWDQNLPVRASKGSYSCLGMVTGVQRLSNIARVQVVGRERVLIQAVSTDRGFPRALAAILPDRWCYYVRAEAVDEALFLEPDETFGKDVVAAMTNVKDAAEEVVDCMNSLASLTQRLLENDGVGKLVANDWPWLLDWCLGEESQPNQVRELRDWCAITRLSYAPFVSLSAAQWLGEDLSMHRKAAMEATDVGLRLEKASEFARKLAHRK